MKLNYDFTVGSGAPVMQIKHLLKVYGCRADLHHMIRADERDCFHTHPAFAIRVVLAGGYVEEVYPGGHFQAWAPGDIGIIKPDFCHRIEYVTDQTKGSYSLWLRGRITHDVELYGRGWERLGYIREGLRWLAPESKFREP